MIDDFVFVLERELPELVREACREFNLQTYRLCDVRNIDEYNLKLNKYILEKYERCKNIKQTQKSEPEF